MTITALLLAAGLSTRMGRPKPLLPWHGYTLLEYQVEQLVASGVDYVIAVLGYEAEAVRARVTHPLARAVLNPDYAEGRASSLRTGAASLGPNVDTIVILGVDQPRPSQVTARLLAEQRLRGSTITLPTHQGHRGHPVVLAGSSAGELAEVREETLGLRAVLERHAAQVVEVEFESPVVLLDLNTPADYERARQLLGA